MRICIWRYGRKARGYNLRPQVREHLFSVGLLSLSLCRRPCSARFPLCPENSCSLSRGRGQKRSARWKKKQVRTIIQPESAQTASQRAHLHVSFNGNELAERFSPPASSLFLALCVLVPILVRSLFKTPDGPICFVMFCISFFFRLPPAHFRASLSAS